MVSGRAAGSLALLAAALSCARAHPNPLPSPFAPPEGSAERSKLPPVPFVRGPVELRVVYPPPDAVVDVRDSSFLLGSAGAGDALVTVNGTPARVWPNGGWVAWVPFPRDTLMRFEIVARTPRDTAELVHLVRRAPRFEPPPAPVWIDSTSLSPRGRVWLQPGQYLTLSARAAEGSVLRLLLPDGTAIPLQPRPAPLEPPAAIRAFELDTAALSTPLRADRYAGLLRARRVGGDPGPVLPAPAAALAAAARVGGGTTTTVLPDTAVPLLEAIRGPDTARVRWPLQVGLLDTLPIVVELNDDPRRQGGTDSLTVGRATPGGSYHWFFPTGTRSVVIRRVNQDVELGLAPGLGAWVPAAEAMPLPPGTPAPHGRVGSITLTPLADRVSLRIPVGERVPFQVVEGDRSLRLTLYHATGDVNWIRYGPELPAGVPGAEESGDSLVRRVAWLQQSPGEVALDIALARPVWGYRTRWSGTDLIFEVRRPPAIDRRHPLRGRLVVVDPGHPPAGATGPTGLREAEANLAVALRLGTLLEKDGARVVLTRAADTPLDLRSRVRLADSIGADLLISIHNNALPDGLNPLTNNGTSVYYNQPRSIPLARAIQRALVERLGLRDLGVARGDLALVRPTWMPAVLCEGLYIILPDQEAALRSAKGQDLYAKAVAEGTREFLKSVSARLLSERPRRGAGLGEHQERLDQDVRPDRGLDLHQVLAHPGTRVKRGNMHDEGGERRLGRGLVARVRAGDGHALTQRDSGMAEEPERHPVERGEEPPAERQALPVERDQPQGRSLVVPAGVDHEPVAEPGLLARDPAEGGPELLLAEGDRVVRDHEVAPLSEPGG